MAAKHIKIIVVVDNGVVEDIYTNAQYPIEYQIIELDSQDEEIALQADTDHEELIKNNKFHSIVYAS